MFHGGFIPDNKSLRDVPNTKYIRKLLFQKNLKRKAKLTTFIITDNVPREDYMDIRNKLS